MTNETLLEIWRRASLIYHFELAVCKAVDEKRITAPVYVSLGQEFIPATVSMLCKDMPLFAQHRCHGWYLAWGGDMGLLIDELLHGRCGSASIHIPGKMYGHDGLMGSQAPIAAGYALATGKPVVCVLGDGAAEEDYVLSTLGWAATRKLPILFIVENNGLSILTPVEARRSWSIRKLSVAMEIRSMNLEDDPQWMLPHCNLFVLSPAPRLIEILCRRHRWHCGTGTDGEPMWNRRELFLVELERRNLGPAAADIDLITKIDVETAWASRI